MVMPILVYFRCRSFAIAFLFQTCSMKPELELELELFRRKVNFISLHLARFMVLGTLSLHVMAFGPLLLVMRSG